MWKMIRGAAAPSILVVIASLGLAAPAAAVPVTYQVSVDPISSGPFVGQSLSGTFTFDDSVIPAGGTGSVSPVPLLDMSINFGTLSFDETTAGGLFLEFVDSLLVDFLVGGNINGLHSVAGHTNDFYLTANTFAYATTASLLGFGSAISFSLVPAVVPEPATLALFGAGLAGLGWIGRRRKAV